MIRPDYDNSILSIPNSLLKYYGATPHHATLPLLDGLLAKDYRNVVLLVMDGMGVNVLNRNLPKDAFLHRQLRQQISSVYPCTTTAAITSILSGKTPMEHGWIGYSNYFREADQCIDLFSNRESGTKNAASGEHLPNRLLAYEDIFTQLGDRVKTYAVSPFSEYAANTMEEVCGHIEVLCRQRHKKFIYAYHYQPDYDMHDYGVSASEIQRRMVDYNRRLDGLAASLKDTLLLITADHGMTDIHMQCVEDTPEISQALVRHICMEPRCCSLYVKKECKADFKQRFLRAFGDEFLLVPHDEFLQSGLMGSGIPHPKVPDFVGDFVAIAVSHTALWYRDVDGECNDFHGAHAGLTTEEMMVPLLVVEKE